eukprot:TRINITY_DN5153_c0_g1_i1.p1 TRINITY_DN5153_c0_g1~~TRINITY_DN5153_c0_g1_i1.p1  ORF type:complete len:239 (+),score=47.16 TRINITY_DN5153_c0_g1_i1:24-719(+)
MPDLMQLMGGGAPKLPTTPNRYTMPTISPSTPTHSMHMPHLGGSTPSTPNTPSFNRMNYQQFSSPYSQTPSQYNPYPVVNVNGKRPGEPMYSSQDKRMKGEEPEDDIEGQIESGDQEVRQKSIMSILNKEQLNRWEDAKNSTFARGQQKETIKRVMKAVSGSKVSPEAVLVMGGITKVFVCEVVECARTVMDEWGETGAIRPHHLREAYRRLKKEEKIDPSPLYKKQLWKR